MDDALISALASVGVATITGVFSIFAHKKKKSNKTEDEDTESLTLREDENRVKEHLMIMVQGYQEQFELLTIQTESIMESNVDLKNQVHVLKENNRKLNDTIENLKDELSILHKRMKEISSMNATYEMQIKMLMSDGQTTYLAGRRDK